MNHSKTTKIYASLVGALLLTACNPHDPIYGTDHPHQGRIDQLTTDWTACTGDLPDSYSVRIDNNKSILSGNVNQFNRLLDPGSYTVYLFNESTDVAVVGNTAIVRPNSVTSRADNPFITPLPEWFYTSHQDITLLADQDYDLSMRMEQQMRQVTLVLTILPVADITDLSAILEGVAGSMDFVAGTYGTPSAVPLSFTRQTDGTWTVAIRLLGFLTDSGASFAPLRGTITFAGGYQTTFESDLSELFAGFNSAKNQPLTLRSEIELERTASGFSATIAPWEKITDGTAIAD
ncbi:MAG: hypothetical protein LBN06_06275 [Prevotellaceae bacterium]|jgi:hypothetical protein|nr:hypothetical protein [Prevotellaceae bacterium]